MAVTQQDVLTALLAFDAYNRSDDKKKAQLLYKDETLATFIGTARWVQNSDGLSGAVASGFSASQYSTPSGTVIAYRGTDFPTSLGTITGFLQDFWNGWLPSIGVGSGSTRQPYYAQRFYELVTGRSLFPAPDATSAPAPSGLIITGHSLGGALAGYIGSLTNAKTVTFNEIPYLGMALLAAINHYLDTVKDRVDVQALANAVWQVIQGQQPSLPGFVLPTGFSVTSFRMKNEIAGLARALGPVLGTIIEARSLPAWLDGSAIKATIANFYGLSADSQNAIVPIDPHGGRALIDGASLHSQALMTINVFSNWQNYTQWHVIGQEMFNALFDGSIATTVGVGDLKGYGGAAAKMMGTIAYSTVE